MFGIKKSAKSEVKLPGPQLIPGVVQKYLVTERKIDPELVKLLKAVTRRGADGETASSIRVFDDSEALARKILVKNYLSLDEQPVLILYEGQFDERANKVEMEEKKRISCDTPIFSEAEIMAKIEALKEPGSTVFIYTARGPCHGGPLGMGAAIVELNPAEKGRKYVIYTADVIETEPVGKGTRVFDSNKPKEIARWIKETHHKRMY